MISFHILVATLACAAALVHASWSFDGETCDQTKKDIVTEEIGNAFDMALFTSAHFSPEDYDNQDDPQYIRQYYYDFIAENERVTKAKPMPVMYNIYKNISLMLKTQPANPGYVFTITCNDATRGCGRGWLAHMNDENKVMNFCNKFFAEEKVGVGVVATTVAMKACYDSKATFNLRTAQHTRGAIILHECTHTNYAMAGLGATKDIAYGFNANWLLPQGLFDRSCAVYGKPSYGAFKILCGEDSDPTEPPKEGTCRPEKAIYNADTYSFIATGVYFSQWCGKVQYPKLPDVSKPTKKARSRVSRNPRSVLQRRNICPDDDSIVFDGPDPS